MRREVLRKYCSTFGWPLGFVEKDYLQHIILRAIAKRAGPTLVFKGGTALQKVWGVPRFSEDLDFTQTNQFNLEQVLDEAIRILRRYNHEASLKMKEKRQISTTYKIVIQGPLYQGQDMSLCHIKIEVSGREEVLCPPKPIEVQPLYTNLPAYLISTMTREEIMAEKVRAIYSRARGRDLYDLAYLLNQGIKPSLELINQKLTYYDLEFSYQTFQQRLNFSADEWESEVLRLLSIPMSVDRALSTVRDGFSNLEAGDAVE